MAKPRTSWQVSAHDPIEKLSDRLWRVAAPLPDFAMKRVMTIARRADGSLVIHNAIALDEAAMAEIDGWGPVGTIVVPNGFHRLDAKPYAARYPAARVLCPRGATKKVAQVVEVAGAYEDLSPDGAVELVTLDGTKQREGAMIVRGSVTSVVLNDAVFNMEHLPGFAGFVLRRITASTGGPRVSRVARWLIVSDRAAFRAHLERLAALPALAHVVVSHDRTITDDPAGTLRRVAATM
jgi:hypothetical protein